MGRPPKNEIADDEKLAVITGKQKKSSIYRTQAAEFAESQISKTVSGIAEKLEAASKIRGRISLADFETVELLTFRYLEACKKAGILPTMVGLALSFGVTHQAIGDYVKRHDDRSSEWFKMIKEGFADSLLQSCLKGDVNSIVGIFTLKAAYGWTESTGAEVTNNDSNSDSRLSAAEIRNKYANLIED